MAKGTVKTVVDQNVTTALFFLLHRDMFCLSSRKKIQSTCRFGLVTSTRHPLIYVFIDISPLSCDQYLWSRLHYNRNLVADVNRRMMTHEVDSGRLSVLDN